jgi:hypothetical protein
LKEDNAVEFGDEGRTNIEALNINMVFVILAEFRAPEASDVAELLVGTERAGFEKPTKPGEHMKPLYVKGHIDGTPMGRMMIDGGASVNIMPLMLFEKLGCHEDDLKKTNMSLSGFSREPAEAKGIVSKELMVGCKTIPMAFFMVNVNGWYNVLLGRDWIHANGYVPSTVHQCVV